jgi:hypothetical protein
MACSIDVAEQVAVVRTLPPDPVKIRRAARRGPVATMLHDRVSVVDPDRGSSAEGAISRDIDGADCEFRDTITEIGLASES